MIALLLRHARWNVTCGYGGPCTCRFQRILDVAGPSLVGINVMHTNFNTVEHVLKFLREAPPVCVRCALREDAIGLTSGAVSGV